MKLVIDTSLLIDYLRGGSKTQDLFERLELINSELFIPTIVIYELFGGKSAENLTIKTKVVNLIKPFKRIDLTEQIAIRAGEFYRKLGSQIGSSDYIIAASALEISGTILTLNTKHFEKILGLSLYPI